MNAPWMVLEVGGEVIFVLGWLAFGVARGMSHALLWAHLLLYSALLDGEAGTVTAVLGSAFLLAVEWVRPGKRAVTTYEASVPGSGQAR